MEYSLESIRNEELIDLCNKGDRAAWSVFIDRYSGLIYKAISIRLMRCHHRSGKEEKDEIFQEFLLSLFENNRLSEIKNISALNYWLIVSAGNAAVDFLRRNKTGSNIISLSDDIQSKFQDEGGCVTLEDRLSSGSNPRDTAYYKEVDAILKQIIERLDARDRIVIELNIIFGKSHKQIADTMKIPINTVSTVIQRTKQTIRDELSRRGVENI